MQNRKILLSILSVLVLAVCSASYSLVITAGAGGPNLQVIYNQVLNSTITTINTGKIQGVNCTPTGYAFAGTINFTFEVSSNENPNYYLQNYGSQCIPSLFLINPSNGIVTATCNCIFDDHGNVEGLNNLSVNFYESQ